MVHHPPPPEPRSRFKRRPGPNADPRTRRDETLAFADETPWRPPAWFERLSVVLVEPTDPVNIGSVVRVMANTGFERLRLVNPVAVDPWDVIGVAHYTQHIVDAATHHASLAEALADTTYVVALTGKHHRAKRNALSLPDALGRIVNHAQSGHRVALVFGREDHGLPNEALDRCHAVATIPTNPAYPSLNLAQSALLALYGLFQRAGGEDQVVRPPRRSAPLATAELLQALFEDLARALDAVEFFKTRSRASIMRSLRTVLYRADLDEREAALIRAVALEVRRHLVRRGLLAEMGPVGSPAASETGGSPAAERRTTGRAAP